MREVNRCGLGTGGSECHSQRSWRLGLGVWIWGLTARFHLEDLPAASVLFAVAPELFLPHTHIRGTGEGREREERGREEGREKGRKGGKKKERKKKKGERTKGRKRKGNERKERKNETKRKEKKSVHPGSRKQPT